MSPNNDFHRDLSWSKAQADDPMWEAVYRQAFPTFSGMAYVHDDGEDQRSGVDRIVSLAGGRRVLIDEKVRRKVYPDILLEFWSVYVADKKKRKPGWIAKNLATDYIAYAFLPVRTAYLLPFLQLRRAWYVNRREWVAKFGTREAQNPGYVTVSCPVPTATLMAAIQDAMTVRWP